jgi:hypothetical protein
MNATRFYSAVIKLDRDLDETRLGMRARHWRLGVQGSTNRPIMSVRIGVNATFSEGVSV